MPSQTDSVKERARSFESIAENAPDIIIRFDRSLRHVYVNRARELAAGWPRERFLGKTHRELGFPADKCALWDGILRDVFETGERRKLEFDLEEPTGSRRFLEAVAVPETGTDGQVETVLVMTRDITGRRVTEEELRKIEMSLSAAQRVARMGNWDWNIAQNTLWWSEQIYAVFGLNPATFAATFDAFLEVVHPEDRQRVLDAVHVALARGATYEIVHRIVRPDGSVRTVHEIGDVERDDAGRASRMIGTVQDITEQRRLEAALSASEHQLRFTRFALDHAGDSVFFVKPDGRIIYANRRAGDRLGYTVQELCERRVSDLDPLFPPDRFEVHFAELREAGRLAFETVHQTRSGERYPVEVTAQYVSFEGQEYNCAFVRDITARRALEDERNRLLALEQHAREEAERANRLKDQFLAIVSHELRTPVTSILLGVQHLRRLEGVDGPVGDGLAKIERRVRAQRQIVEDLLDVSRISSGKLSLRLASVDPASLCRMAAEAIHDLAVQRNVTLTVDVEPGLPTLQADGTRLEQVLWNLLSNAVKFTPPGGRVRLSCGRTPAPGRLRFSVADTGVGIAPAFLQEIFSPFSQADVSSTRAHQGLGLGLAISHAIAELHDGTLCAESAGPGHGATLTLELPCPMLEAPRPAEGRAQPEPTV